MSPAPNHRISLDPDQLAAVMDALLDAAKRADINSRRSSSAALDTIDIRRAGLVHRLRSVYEDIKRQVSQPQCTCNPRHRGYCQLEEGAEDIEGASPATAASQPAEAS